MKIQNPIIFTKDGYEKLQSELENLKKKRLETLESLKRAREMGDLSENGLYKAARFELGNIDRRTRQINHLLANAEIKEAVKGEKVSIGCFVEIDDGVSKVSYQIVGEYEGDPAEGKLSHKSPIGYKLLGKRVGESIVLESPGGSTIYTISSIR